MSQSDTGVLHGPDTMNAPWGLASRLKLLHLARDFFHFNDTAASHDAIGKKLPTRGAPEPLAVHEFLHYLRIKRAYDKTPSGFRVAQLLRRFADHGLLVHISHYKPSIAGTSDRYLYMPILTNPRQHVFQYVPALGPELIYHLCSPGLVRITGTNDKGDVVAGTGLIIDHHHVLTCAHVVDDMEVDDQQTFQRIKHSIQRNLIHVHSRLDVAVIRVSGPPLTPPEGILFQQPVVAQEVYALGFPKLPGLRDASVTMQQGAVTNPAVTSLNGVPLFLYSAISRPGNSGGPIISADGYVVGLSVVDSTAQYHDGEPFSPHYAGIPAPHVVNAVQELGIGLNIPWEPLE